MPTLTSTVRLSARTYARLRGLAEASGRPMSSVVEEALDRYEVDRFFDDLDTAYRELRATPRAWHEEQTERALLEQTLQDGLDDD